MRVAGLRSFVLAADCAHADLLLLLLLRIVLCNATVMIMMALGVALDGECANDTT